MGRLLQHGPLRTLAREILHRAGAPEAEAQQVADHLVDANLAGHDSHGVGMIPTYTWSMKCGALDPAAHAERISDRGAVIVVDGKHGFGQVVAPEAMAWAIERAREQGVAMMALREAHHLGRIGAYAELAVAEGLVSMHYVNVVGHPPQVAPFGGAEARLNTNPYCCGIPVPGGEPVLLDMATSTVALGKVREAMARGDKVPMGSLIDPAGRPSDDPAVIMGPPDAPKGALTSFGLHKGYGMALICDLLGGALAGSWAMNKPYDGPPTVYNGMLAIVLDPAAVGDAGVFGEAVASMVSYIHGTRPGEGTEQVLVAGDPERRARRQRVDEGILVADGTWQGLCDMGTKFGLTLEAIEAMVS